MAAVGDIISSVYASGAAPAPESYLEIGPKRKDPSAPTPRLDVQRTATPSAQMLAARPAVVRNTGFVNPTQVEESRIADESVSVRWSKDLFLAGEDTRVWFADRRRMKADLAKNKAQKKAAGGDSDDDFSDGLDRYVMFGYHVSGSIPIMFSKAYKMFYLRVFDFGENKTYYYKADTGMLTIADLELMMKFLTDIGYSAEFPNQRNPYAGISLPSFYLDEDNALVLKLGMYADPDGRSEALSEPANAKAAQILDDRIRNSFSKQTITKNKRDFGFTAL